MKILHLAFAHGTPKKAFLTSLFVGTLLLVINHGDQILRGQFPHVVKIIFTYLIPYLVTTWGSILGKKTKLNLEKKED